MGMIILKKIKNISLVILLFGVIFLISGCSNSKKLTSNVTGTTTVKETIVDDSFDKDGSGTLSCTTDAVATDGIEVDINYVVDYKNGNILYLRSIQKVISEDELSLDLYEDAFRNIVKNYEGLKYYDVSLERNLDNVIYDIAINYDKIDTDELLSIEGEEDNIIVNGKAKLALWLELASKFGTTCVET